MPKNPRSIAILIPQVLDTLFLAYIVLISKDPGSLNELASYVPEPESASSGKGKGKAAATEPPQALVDVLFAIWEDSLAKDSKQR